MRLSELTPLIVPAHIAALMLGCMIGSFLNVVVWRVPQGMSLVYPPSHCPNCGHAIRPWENIPVLSWLFLRGRCSGCHQPISIRYPLGELATGAVYALVFYAAWKRNLPLAAVPGAFFVLGTLVCVTQIDLKHRMIPDLITVTGLVTALLLALLLPESRLIFNGDLEDVHCGTLAMRSLTGWLAERGIELMSIPLLAAGVDCLLGMLTGAVLLGAVALTGTLLARAGHPQAAEAMGWGDVKFLAMLGAFCGADACVYIACGASVLGFVCGLALRLCKRRREPEAHGIAFGPFLSVAAMVWLLFGRFW